MSLLRFAHVDAFWLAALAIPLILLYVLKLRRPQRVVSSLVLWQQVLADQRVNMPFRRFRRERLLLVELLLLACVVIAASQPYWSAGDSYPKAAVILIDCSASMAGLDQVEGQSRLELAKERAGKMIDNLLPQQQLFIISVSNRARRLTELTNNKRLLKEALTTLIVEDVPSQLDDALRQVQAVASTHSIEQVLFITDGNLPDQTDVELNYDVNIEQLPVAGPNLGITGVQAQRVNDHWDIQVHLQSSAGANLTGVLEVSHGGAFITTKTITAPNGSDQSVHFSLSTATSGRIAIQWKPNQFDSLEADNVAWVELPVPRPLAVSIPPAQSSILSAISAAEPNAVLNSASPTEGVYDLVVCDYAPDQIPPGRITIVVGQIPLDLQSFLATSTAAFRVTDWDRTATLLRHVPLAELHCAPQSAYSLSIPEGELKRRGYHVLAEGSTGPLILAQTLPEQQVYWFLFDPEESSLPYQVGLPVLTLNALELARQAAGLDHAKAQHTGVLSSQLVTAGAAVSVTDPHGNRHPHFATQQGFLKDVAVPFCGEYVLAQDGQEIGRVAASLLSSAESSLATHSAVNLRQSRATNDAVPSNSGRPLWSWFVWAGLIVFACEWWLLQRNIK